MMLRVRVRVLDMRVHELRRGLVLVLLLVLLLVLVLVLVRVLVRVRISVCVLLWVEWLVLVHG